MTSGSSTAADRNPRSVPAVAGRRCPRPPALPLQNVASGGSERDLPDRLPMSIRRAWANQHDSHAERRIGARLPAGELGRLPLG